MVQQIDWFSTIDKTWKCYKRLFLKRSKDKWIEIKFYGKTEKRSDAALKYYGCGKQGSRALLQDTALPILGYYTICDLTWNARSMKRPLLDGWQVFIGAGKKWYFYLFGHLVLFNTLRFSLHHCTGVGLEFKYGFRQIIHKEVANADVHRATIIFFIPSIRVEIEVWPFCLLKDFITDLI